MKHISRNAGSDWKNRVNCILDFPDWCFLNALENTSPTPAYDIAALHVDDNAEHRIRAELLTSGT